MSDVPSNLVPVRMSALPIAPQASGEMYVIVTYQGTSYRVRAADLLQVSGVPTTTQVIAGTGLTGGGQLTGNVTLSIATAGVDSTLMSVTGATPGTYGSSTRIPVLTMDQAGRITAIGTAQVSGGDTLPDGDYGDITVSADGTHMEINAGVVTTTEMGGDVTTAGKDMVSAANAAAQRSLLGLGTLALQNSPLGLADGGTGSSLADPNADRLLFWDDSNSATGWLTLGTNLSILGTTLNASGGGGGGDVSGPVSSTTMAIAIYADTSGTLIADTGVLIDGSNNVTGVADLGVTTVNSVTTNATTGNITTANVTSIEFGGGTDTTLTRSGAGNLTIEGNVIYRANGTDVALSDGGTGASLTDPNADRLMFWDDSAGSVAWLTPGTGLSIATTTIDVSFPIAAPGSSTNTAAAVWSGTGGNTLANSTLLVGASDVTIGGNGIYRAGGTDVPVADGGTGASSLTAYAVLCGGTTSTGAVQPIASVGTVGQVLTSNGPGALPTFQANPGNSGMTTIVKPSDTSRSSTSSFAADPDLQFAMLANTTYAIRITAVFTANTSPPGAKAELDGPASPTRVEFTTYYNRNSASATPVFAAQGAYNSGIFLNLTGTPDYAVLHVEGIVQNGANAGTFSLRWAQNSSSVSPTTCLAGSILEYKAA